MRTGCVRRLVCIDAAIVERHGNWLDIHFLLVFRDQSLVHFRQTVCVRVRRQIDRSIGKQQQAGVK